MKISYKVPSMKEHGFVWAWSLFYSKDLQAKQRVTDFLIGVCGHSMFKTKEVRMGWNFQMFGEKYGEQDLYLVFPSEEECRTWAYFQATERKKTTQKGDMRGLTQRIE